MPRGDYVELPEAYLPLACHAVLLEQQNAKLVKVLNELRVWCLTPGMDWNSETGRALLLKASNLLANDNVPQVR